MTNFEMQSKTGSVKGSSTQGFLLISQIKGDTIITRDGGLRAVVVVSSTNFVLKSPEEQTAIIQRFQSFLNALDFPIQILIQSRRLDIHSYLEKLREKQLQQQNELLRVQTEEYIEYIKKLLQFGNIMGKTFYVIVPYAGGIMTNKKGLASKLSNLLNPAKEISMSQEKFVRDCRVIGERVAHIEGGLSSIGLRTMRLNTQELVELLYHSYNLIAIEGEKVEIENMQVVTN